MSKKDNSLCGRFWNWLLPSIPNQPEPTPRRSIGMTPLSEGAPLSCQAVAPEAYYGGPGDDEIDLFQLWQIVWNARRFIALVTFTASLAAVLVTLFVLPVTFKSEAVLMPTDTQGGGGALGALAASLPLPVALPGTGKTDLILSFLQSRTLQQRLIEKYNLLPRLYEDLWDARQNRWLIREAEQKKLLGKALQREIFKEIYTADKDKKTELITLSWVDKDPAFAAEMLRRVIAELTYYLDNENVTDAMRNRQFVEGQLAQATRDLVHWERRIPTAELVLAEIQRERLVAQTMYSELRRQLELARIAEAKEVVRFKVLDPPYVPELKFKPKRALICVLTMITSGMLAVVFVFGCQALRNRRREREQEQAGL